MGKKEEIVKKPESEEEEEDTPTVKQLKELDDKYCAIEIELEQEIEKLRQKYDAKQAPLLEERRQVLSDASTADDDAKAKGTPACPGFWAQALENASEIEECLHECDEPVLQYLHDVKKADLDSACPQKGIRLEFHFKENPYFTNEVLPMEVSFDYDPSTYKPWKDTECIEVKGTTIDWKPGKDITVEKVVKEVKGKKGAKKSGKAKEEPCASFFRILFTSSKKDQPLPEELECVYEEDEDDESEDMNEFHLENIGQLAHFISEELLPYAVRYYTGEAGDDDDDDDDEDEESEEDDDGDDEEDDSEDEPPAKAGKGSKKKAAGGEKTEECKQQ